MGNIGKLVAEAIGTFWLVLGGCGSAVLAAAWAADPHLGIGFVGVSLAFGLTVLTMAVAIGHISGCHLNPAVTAGLVASGRFPAKDLPGYVVAQVIGGILGALVLHLVASGLQLIIHLERQPDGKRKLVDMVELCGIEKGRYLLQPLMHYNPQSGEFEFTGVKPTWEG